MRIFKITLDPLPVPDKRMAAPEAKEKELIALIDKTKRDLEYWHRIFRSFSVVPCAYCGKQMRVYPYGGAYYHIEDNRKVHAGCYDKYLADKRRKET